MSGPTIFVQFSNGQNKMAAKKYLVSLDVLLIRVIKNILFMPKRSRLVTGHECPGLA
jgi:hypothetical protein